MNRPAVHLLFFFVSAALLAVSWTPPAQADSGPTLSAVFGIAGHYRPGGWCPVTVTVRNPGLDPISGQLQVRTADDTGRPAYGRPVHTAPSEIFACPVTVSGGSPQTFPLYLRGIDPGSSNLTIQLVEGRERGDGRVLAEINTQDPKTSAAFTGGPVAPGDQLLVAFGGDPGAFLFLNGQREGAGNTANSNMPNAGMPATLQIAEASASNLPGKAAGYGGIDTFLLRSDAPLEALTEAQSGALKGWVASGGHLIVAAGSDSTRFGSAFFDGLLPATIGAAPATGALTLTPKPLLGVRVVTAAADGTPQSVSGPYGAGSVTLTDGTSTAPAFWQTLLSSPSDYSSVLSLASDREENLNGGYYYGGGPPLLSEAVMHGPSLDAPGTPAIGAFLLVYLIVLVPGNYLVLKRLDRKEWAWVTIPALVLVFALGTFGVGYAVKGGRVFVNRAALVETSAGRSEAGVDAALGLFSPRRTSYDIALTGTSLTAAIPPSEDSYGNRGDDTQTYEPLRLVQTSAGVSLPNTPVNMWAMRAFDTRSTIDLGGTIDGSLLSQGGMPAGNIVNHTAYPLDDCAVLCGGRWLRLGTLAAGASVPVSASWASSTPQSAFPDALPPSPGSAQSSMGDRMHDAVAGYFRSFSQTYPNFNSGYSSSPIYAPAPGEAVLIGWSRDPALAGPSPKIDGRTVTENDVSLVIVHVPIAGAPLVPAVGPVSAPSLQAQSVHAFSPPAWQIIGPAQFAPIAKSAPNYRQALEAAHVQATSRLVGKVVHVRGTVSVLIRDPRLRGVLIDFEPDVAQRGLTAILPYPPWTRDPGVLALLGHEIVITGIMSRSPETGAGQVLVVRPAQVQVAL